MLARIRIELWSRVAQRPDLLRLLDQDGRELGRQDLPAGQWDVDELVNGVIAKHQVARDIEIVLDVEPDNRGRDKYVELVDYRCVRCENA